MRLFKFKQWLRKRRKRKSVDKNFFYYLFRSIKMPSRKRPAKKSRKSKKAKATKIGYFIRSKRILVAKKRSGKRVDHKGSRLRKGLRVYKRKSQAQKALKRKASKKKSRKCKYGVDPKSGKCRQKYGGNKGNSSRSRRDYRKKSRKASRKRRSGRTIAEIKAECKRLGLVYDRNTKRCRQRKSAKRKSPKKSKKRKSPKKSKKRKSPKKKSKKRKSKFRVHKYGGNRGDLSRSHRDYSHKKHHGSHHKKHHGSHHKKHHGSHHKKHHKKHHGEHHRKSWASKTAMSSAARRRLAKKNKKCFLGKGMKYPICLKSGRPSCQGVLAAKSRAALVDHTRSRYASSKSRRMAKSVHKKASRLAKKHGCHHVYDHFRGKL